MKDCEKLELIRQMATEHFDLDQNPKHAEITLDHILDIVMFEGVDNDEQDNEQAGPQR